MITQLLPVLPTVSVWLPAYDLWLYIAGYTFIDLHAFPYVDIFQLDDSHRWELRQCTSTYTQSASFLNKITQKCAQLIEYGRLGKLAIITRCADAHAHTKPTQSESSTLVDPPPLCRCEPPRLVRVDSYICHTIRKSSWVALKMPALADELLTMRLRNKADQLKRMCSARKKN